MICLAAPHTASQWMYRALGLDTFTHPATAHAADRVAEADLIVSPLRQPKSVWHTFCKYSGESTQWFFDNWYALAHFDAEYPIHYIPMDLPERQTLFAEVSDNHPNWDLKINSSDRAVCAEYLDLSPIMAMPFIERFYGPRV